MQKPIQQKPSYSIESVDNALRLVQRLRDDGSLRLKDAAEELEVAPSTAHRLLAMLVYRGFAIQDESRRYWPGPSLGAPAVRVSWTRELREVTKPHLEALSSRIEETSNLMIRVGTRIRFILSCESSRVLRVGDRQGSVLPAISTSGGKALLADLEDQTLERLFRTKSAILSGEGLDDSEFAAARREFARIRREGFAQNRQLSELGVGAVGFSLRGAGQRSIAAFSVSVPIARYPQLLDRHAIGLCLATRLEIEHDLASNKIDGSDPEPAT